MQQERGREEERPRPDFVPWFWQLRGYTLPGGCQKSLLLTGTFISNILIQEILAIDSGSQCVGFRSCLCPHKDPCLPHLLLFYLKPKSWSCNQQFTLDKLLRYHLESKAEVIKKVLKTFVIKDSQDISDGLWGLCPLLLFYQTTWLCFGFVLCLLGLCQQCLPVLLSASLIVSMQTNPSPYVSFSQMLKIVILLDFQ